MKGPQKAPSFLRSTTRIDHNPERCKDYYEHGYCGYGDTCIFIHDRSDYKSGHQLEEEYQRALKQRQKKIIAGERDVSSETESNYEISQEGDLEKELGEIDPKDGLPTKCTICEKDFKDPIVTLCKHYFCEACALQNYVNDKLCFICGADTKGSFSTATNIEAKMKGKAKQPEATPEDEEAVMKDFLDVSKKAKETRFATQNGWIIP